MKFYLAIDLKDKGGTFTVGEFSDIKLNTIHLGSFKQQPYLEGDIHYWDINYIYDEIKKGIARAVKIFGSDLISIGITTWGNDFGLLDENDELLQDPMSHIGQDNRSVVEQFHSLIPEDTLYEITADCGSDLSSLFQLLGIKKRNPQLLEKAKCFLMIPSIINYWLTGIKTIDKTMASTTQLYYPNANEWSTQLIGAIGLPVDIFPKLTPPGTILGPIQESVRDELGISHELKVVVPGAHDSACTTASIPSLGGNFAYLSSGTWSILGVNIDKPIVSKRALKKGFTNESGVDRSVNLLRVARGHWALEQCRKSWAAEDGQSTSWEDIACMALVGTPFSAVIDITDPCFQKVGNMTEILADYCKRTGQNAPQTREDIARVFMEGMALQRKRTVMDLEPLINQRIYSILVAGSGAQNHALNIFTANALNRRVIAGPFSATAYGNLIMQMIAMGDVSTITEGKKLIKNSIISVEYNATGEDGWDDAYAKLINL